MSDHPQKGELITDALASQMVQQNTIYFNVAQDTIIVTEDRLRLCLLEHLSGLESKRLWIAPAGILLTLVATLATSSFHDFYLKAAIWQALFITAAVIDGVWLAVLLFRAFSSPSVDDVVGRLKPKPRAEVRPASPEQAVPVVLESTSVPAPVASDRSWKVCPKCLTTVSARNGDRICPSCLAAWY